MHFIGPLQHTVDARFRHDCITVSFRFLLLDRPPTVPRQHIRVRFVNDVGFRRTLPRPTQKRQIVHLRRPVTDRRVILHLPRDHHDPLSRAMPR